uniref:Plastid lipid-associated protein/fibrillin conserved domain-containing protein n=1 Tax=Brassica oleracea var. oleracea TaxID=109376 RepID=A0A0D3BDP5_BRAOL
AKSPFLSATSLKFTGEKRGGGLGFVFSPLGVRRSFGTKCSLAAQSQAEPDGSHLRPGPRPENPERRHEARRDRECHRGHGGDRGKLCHHRRFAVCHVETTVDDGERQLFIIEKAGLFGTRAGEVLQVIDVRKGTLNNVITFPPVIDPSQSTTLSTSLQTCTRLKTFSYKKETKALFSAFVCNSKNVSPFSLLKAAMLCKGTMKEEKALAVLRGSNWEIPLPPFGQGWFENVYMDGDIRVAKDIRGDYLVVDRPPFNWKE